jgi:hypothetical protein
MLVTSGICAWTSNDPGPLPAVPGSGSEFAPSQLAHPGRSIATLTIPIAA